jgi:hypothetical protein
MFLFFIYIYIYIHTHIYMYVHIYIYIYIYIHTHTHVYLSIYKCMHVHVYVELGVGTQIINLEKLIGLCPTQIFKVEKLSAHSHLRFPSSTICVPVPESAKHDFQTDNLR